MEGGPTQPNEVSPEKRRQEYEKHVSLLILTPEEKEVLLSAPTETKIGELVMTLVLEKDPHERRVSIDSTTTELERIDEISKALGELHKITIDQNERDIFASEDEDEKFTIEFHEARLH